MRWSDLFSNYPGFFSPWGTHSPGWKLIPRPLRSFRTWRNVIGFLVAILLIQNFVVGIYRVPSSSMSNTLVIGDLLVANKLAYGFKSPPWMGIPKTRIGGRLPVWNVAQWHEIERGDVVVFRHPFRPVIIFVKRVVATGGDTVEIRNKRVFVNGREVLPPPQAKPSRSRVFPAGLQDPSIYPRGMGNRDNYGPVVVPDGHYFVLGDNRDASDDSRYWGTLPEDLVLGRVEMVLFSTARSEDIPIAAGPDRVLRWVY